MKKLCSWIETYIYMNPPQNDIFFATWWNYSEFHIMTVSFPEHLLCAKHFTYIISSNLTQTSEEFEAKKNQAICLRSERW